jgi:hypothetical protein
MIYNNLLAGPSLNLNNNNVNNNSQIEKTSKEELIDQFYAKNLENVSNESLSLNLNEVNKFEFQKTLNSLDENELNLLLDATQNVFKLLQPINERRYAIIKLFLKLPSTQWDQVQKLMSHFLGLNCCIESVYKFLDLIIGFNNNIAREKIINQASQLIKFDMNAFQRVEVLANTAQEFLNSLTIICCLPELISNDMFNKIDIVTDSAKIKSRILAGKPFELVEEYAARREVFKARKSVLDL